MRIDKSDEVITERCSRIRDVDIISTVVNQLGLWKTDQATLAQQLTK